jgi:hypothetical protein
VTLSLRRIISAELLRLGASSVRITEYGGARHARVIATFNGRTLEMSAPRGLPLAEVAPDGSRGTNPATAAGNPPCPQSVVS